MCVCMCLCDTPSLKKEVICIVYVLMFRLVKLNQMIFYCHLYVFKIFPTP